MDGYGVHLADPDADGSAWLSIVGRIQAGGSMAIPRSGGSAVRITTGAQASLQSFPTNMLTFSNPSDEGANIGPLGEDAGRREIIVSVGTFFDARRQAIMAAAAATPTQRSESKSI
jgi:molybdopterin biosynthesis enzyme